MEEVEIWKDIIRYEGFYQISNMGRVKSCKMTLTTNGNTINKEEFFLKPARKNKYVYYELYNIIDNTSKLQSAHRLVAIHFIPNPENKPQVNHKFGNKFDNRAINLEWSTQKENSKHAVNSGLIKKGEDSNLSKLTEKEVKDIRIKYIPYEYTFKKLAEEYSVSVALIGKIINRNKWTHIA